jgi:hypothetical protein
MTVRRGTGGTSGPAVDFIGKIRPHLRAGRWDQWDRAVGPVPLVP